MKVTNIGKRAFFVKKDSVLNGGEIIEGTQDVAINPGDTVDVTDECANFLKTYSDIKIFGPVKKVKKNGVGVS